MIEMQLARIVIRETSDQQAIYLREKDGPRQFPIVIGIVEAFAIDRRVRDMGTQRPMTHDLLASIVRALGGTLERAVISDLRDNTFFAALHFRTPAGEIAVVDARPSDAIALAVHLAAPLFVEDKVLDAVLSSPSEE